MLNGVSLTQILLLMPVWLNRHAAVIELDGKIKLEGSGEADFLRWTKPNKRLDPSGTSLDVIEKLDAIRS